MNQQWRPGEILAHSRMNAVRLVLLALFLMGGWGSAERFYLITPGEATPGSNQFVPRAEAQRVTLFADLSDCAVQERVFTVNFRQYTSPPIFRVYTVNNPPGGQTALDLGVIQADGRFEIQDVGTCHGASANLQANYPPPTRLTADASNPAYVLTGQSAQYRFNNSGEGVTYTINWGDSATENWVGFGGDPTHTLPHTYNTAGVYTIRTVASNAGYTAPERTSTVTVLTPSLRLVPVGQVGPRDNFPIEYRDLPPGSRQTVDWGDGSTSDFVVPAGPPQPLTLLHAYAREGTYTIRTPTLPSLAPLQITIKASPPNLTVSGTGLAATLNISNTQPGTNYTVDWGDNQTSPLAGNLSAQQLNHDYSSPGTYTVNVYGPTSATTTGVLGTATFTATLGNVTLSAAPQRPVVREQVVVTLTGLADSATYDLNWGDGTTEPVTGQTSASRSHAYAAAQDYTITVTNGGRTLGTTTVAVQVPTPVLSHTSQGLTVTLQVQNLVAGAAYTVNWGEGAPEPLNATGPAATLTHAYPRPSTYTMTVTPARGAPASESVSLVASQPKLTITPPVVETDQNVTAALADLTKTLSYTLDWKDGPPITFTAADVVATQTHTYAVPGTYQVELTSSGTNPVSAPVTVRPAAPTLQLVANELSVTLTAAKLYTGVTYTVNWGGVTETFQATGPTMTSTHLYAAPGVQTVTVTPNGGTPATASVTLAVPAPTLVVTPAQGSTDTTFSAVLGQLVPTLTYTLNWGDGVSEPVTGARTFTRTHQYAKPGTFSVSVKYADTPAVQQTVTVNVPTPVLSAASINLNATLRLSRLSPAATYRVQWGDGQEQPLVAQTPEAVVPHTYSAPGTYTITVTPALGDPASVTLNVKYVSVDAPVLTLAPVTANVYDVIKADFSALIPALSYTLDWGDGQREVITDLAAGNRTHTYTTASTYTVSLKAPESPAAVKMVSVTQPLATLSATSAGLQGQATLTGLVKALTYRLDWGDGTPAVDITGVETQTLNHTYARPGTYRLTLSVPGSAPVSAALTVSVPAATLTSTTDALSVTAVVSGLQESLTYRLAWGDGSNTDLTGKVTDTLTHTYAKPGVYTLELSTPGAPSVTAAVTLTLPGVTLSVTPGQGSTDTTFSAVLGQLVPTLTYTLDWGDGVSEPVTGVRTFTRTHQYAKPGTFSVAVKYADAPPVQQTVTVNVPTPVLSATSLNLNATLRLSRLSPAATYRVQWGDGQEQPLVAQTADAVLPHTYTAPGTYTITVTPALGDPGSVTLNVKYVSVDAPVLTLTPVTANVYDVIKADFSALIPALSYTLDWGDGQREVITDLAAGNRTHAYTTAGTYTVSLKAPESPAAVKTVTVTQPLATLSATSAGLQGQATLTGLVKALTYRLDWGDGTPAVDITGVETQTLSHGYARPGTYRLTLSVPGSAPVSAALTVSIPAATLTSTTDALTVTAMVSGLQESLSYRLTWGDGSNTDLTGKVTDTLTHTYAKPGPYTLELSTPGAPSVTATVTLAVPAPTLLVTPAQGSTDTTFSAVLGQLVPTLTYTLNWGDGVSEPVTGAQTFTRTHQYTAPGSFSVSVKYADAAPVQQTVTVKVPVPVLSATNVNLDAALRLSRLSPAATYRVQWGDGQEQPLVAQTPEAVLPHTYTAPGTYTITVTPALGDLASVTLNVKYVSVDAPTLSVAPVTAKIYDVIRADFSALIPALSYTLDWGDGQREVITDLAAGNRTHTYTTASTYTVSLKAPESPAAIKTVTVTQPLATLSATSVGLQGQAILTGLVKALTYRLDWGDGTPAVEIKGVETQTLSHDYARPGDYRLTLSAPGSAPVTATVKVTVAAASLTTTTDALTVTAILSGLQERLTYRLAWGDGSNTDVTGKAADTLTHTYAKPGVYTLELSTPGAPSVTATLTLTLPTPTLVVTPAQGSTDTTFSAVLGQLVPTLTYTLNWGDGVSEPVTGAQTFTRTHQYTAPGSFSVSVKYADAAPVQQTVTVKVPVPVLGATNVNLNATLRLSRLSPAATYRVQWGDTQEQTLTAQTPETVLTHLYATPGTYTITVTPALGDPASVTLNIKYVSVDAPTLSVAPVTAKIYDVIRADFSALIPALSYTLDWGDGQREVITDLASGNRTHTYTTAGSYTVSLKAPESPAAISVLTITQPLATLSATSTALQAQTTLTGLVKALTYRLDWGDGTPAVEIKGVETQTLNHTYARPGTYRLTLSMPGSAPVSAALTVSVPAATLTSTADTLTVTAVVSGLQESLSYRLAWGDGSNTDLTGKVTDTLTHTYAKPGVYTLELSTPGAPSVTAAVTLTLPGVTLSVTPAQGSTDTTFSAVLGQLIPTLTYTLDWGDGVSEPVIGARIFTRTHQYAKPGTFSVSVKYADAPPVQQTVTVNVPTPVLSAINLNLDATLRLSRLSPAATYRVQWGDGQEQPLVAQTPEAVVPHTYSAPGTYTITVTPALGDPASVTLNVKYVSVDAPVLTLAPVTANVYDVIKADFSALIPALSYTLDWGDGQREVITDLAAGNRTHTYTTASTYTVSLKAPESPAAVKMVSVTQPLATLSATSAGLQGQATLTGLVKALTYRLDWGDGTPAVDITGVETQTLNHTYARPGTYRLTLSVPGSAPVSAALTVSVAAATLTSTADALTVTTVVSGLQESLSYRLAWGDGSNTDLTGKVTDTLTHTYAKPGAYTLELITSGAPSVNATVNVQVRPLVLAVVAPELRATASLSGLVSALTYTVNWGDGQQDTVTGQTATTLIHTYLQPGQYRVTVTAPGLEPVTTTFTAGLPPQEVLTPTPGISPDVLDIRITGLLTGATYLLDYGDGQVEPLTFTGQSGRWTHRYARTGVYTLTLNLRTPDGVSSVRAVTTVKAQLQLALRAATVVFASDSTNPNINLNSLDPVAVRLTIDYTGSGSLTGNWLLDGQAGPPVTVNLPDGGTTATATYTVSPPRPGNHTVSFRIADVQSTCAASCPAPVIPGANTVKYTLDSPSLLAYGGLSVKVTSITNADLKIFAGEGTVRLIVGGADLGEQRVTMSNLQVTRSATGYKVTGGDPTRVSLANLPLRLLSLGEASVRLTSLNLRPEGAALSGTVQLPSGTGAGLTFTDASLLEGGELLADLKGSANALGDLKIGTTGISVSATSGVLDLSRKQNADGLSAAYTGGAAPTPDWMGVVLPGANLTIGSPIVPGTPVSVSGLVAYTLGGYATAFDFTPTSLSVGGWAIKSGPLKMSINGSVIASLNGQGSLTVPMVNEPLALTIGWNPQLGNPGAKWEVKSDVAVANHDFGRTALDLGRPTWEFGGDGKAKLIFSNAKWNLGGVSGKDVKVPVYNMTFTPDGGVSLGGEAWASATGLTNFTLFDYPLPAAEIGARREADGQYTMSLRGKIQLGEALPVSATAQPISFWVKDGKDVKIVFEKIRIFGEIKTVAYDVSVSAMFKDEKNLEFIGEGSIKIAKKIAVAAKAGFGRDNGTSYGFFWAAVASAGNKPFVTVGSVGFYEFSGGVGINMVWKDGKFDAPPVKALPPAGAARVVNVAIQAGAVFGTAIDNGTTAHFRGTLGVDSEGTVAIKAVGWLFTPLELGAFGDYSPGAASAAGPNLSTVSTKGSLAPQVAALILLSVPPESPDSGYLLVQGCVGPAAKSSVGGLDCTRNRELDFYNIVAVSGYAEMYMPFSGSGQRVYLGTKANPISVRLLSIKSGSTTTTTTAAVKNADGTTTDATSGTTANSSSNAATAGSSNTTTSRADGLGYNGYLMVDGTQISVGVGVSLAYSVGQSGTGKVCDWYWYANAHLALNADFTVVYDPTSLDASVTLSAGAAAGGGACGLKVDVGINLSITGHLYVSAASSYIDGTASGSVTLPVIGDLPFSVKGRVDF